MITSRNNPQIVATSKLKEKKHREKNQSFLIEGKKLIREALDSGIKLEKIFISENFPYIELPITPEIVSEAVFKKITTQVNPEGILAVANYFNPINLKTNKYLLLENINDPGNLGTILRTADAANITNVILSPDCADIYNPKTIRSSMGAIFHLNILKANLEEYIKKLKNENVVTIGTDLAGKDLILSQVAIPEKWALIFGNEANGISDKVKNLCDQLVKIPIYGQAESLNVAVAAGILIYAYID